MCNGKRLAASDILKTPNLKGLSCGRHGKMEEYGHPTQNIPLPPSYFLIPLGSPRPERGITCARQARWRIWAPGSTARGLRRRRPARIRCGCSTGGTTSPAAHSPQRWRTRPSRPTAAMLCRKGSSVALAAHRCTSSHMFTNNVSEGFYIWDLPFAHTMDARLAQVCCTLQGTEMLCIQGACLVLAETHLSWHAAGYMQKENFQVTPC
jgi:hypothetical protein